MNITEIKSEIAGDSYYKVEHPSDLQFLFVQKRVTLLHMQFSAHATAVSTQSFPLTAVI